HGLAGEFAGARHRSKPSVFRATPLSRTISAARAQFHAAFWKSRGSIVDIARGVKPVSGRGWVDEFHQNGQFMLRSGSEWPYRRHRMNERRSTGGSRGKTRMSLRRNLFAFA